jgi:hypothetical protein
MKYQKLLKYVPEAATAAPGSQDEQKCNFSCFQLIVTIFWPFGYDTTLFTLIFHFTCIYMEAI